jgi:hypothetical protein
MSQKRKPATLAENKIKPATNAVKKICALAVYGLLVDSERNSFSR